VPDAAASTADPVSELKEHVAKLTAERDEFKSERDEYKKLYVSMLELCRKLEAGLVGQKRERFVASGEQLTLALVSMLVNPQAQAAEPSPATPAIQQVEAHTRAKPTGRKPLP
jgi:hypothetical protein